MVNSDFLAGMAWFWIGLVLGELSALLLLWVCHRLRRGREG